MEGAMPCDTRLKRGQTIQQRATEIRKVVDILAKGLTSGKIKPKIGPQGAITFTGLSEQERDGVTDSCAYRRLMATGSAMALQAIARAETLAGRSVDRQMVAQGYHSHDGGITWSSHKH
jgi:hypothetical protein